MYIYIIYITIEPDRMAECVERLCPVLGDQGIRTHGFQPWSSLTNDVKIDICCFLAWCLALLGYGKDWLAQWQDNVTEKDIRSWCQESGLAVEHHYTVATSADCHKYVANLI